MKYLSLCSGIEAASTAWHSLGWEPVAFSEIEPFPCRVLAHHWPHVPNLGDMTRWREWTETLLAAVDILVGGTPCQAFSVAGLRNSLADERGNLTLTYVQILNAIDNARARAGRPPALCFWENVPGVLNTSDNALGCFLAGLAGESLPLVPPGGRWTNAGYVRGPRRRIAWRLLDAQYFEVAQRRERVFVVAGAGDARPAEILFEFESVRRDSPPRRGEGERASRAFETGFNGGRFKEISPTLDAGCKDGPVIAQQGIGVMESVCMATGQAGAEIAIGIGIGIGTTLTCNHEAPIVTHIPQDFTFKASHFTRGKDGAPSPVAPPLSADADKGDQDTLVCVNTGQGFYKESPTAGTLDASPRSAHESNLFCVHGNLDPCVDENVAFALGRNSGQENAIAFTCKDYGGDAGEVSPALRSMGHDASHANGGGQVAIAFKPGSSAQARSIGAQEEIACTLEAGGGGNNRQAVAFAQNSRNEVRLQDGDGEICGALAAEPGMKQTTYLATNTPYAVRRLTPVECEKLQGFPPNHTLIPHPKGYKPRKGEDHAETVEYLIGHGFTPEEAEKLSGHPDGPRYKSLGNSMAVPVIYWVGRRIQKFHHIQ